jgi:hypothetical protein
MADQSAGDPRVFRRDCIDALQDFQRPQGDVRQVSNGRGHYI